MVESPSEAPRQAGDWGCRRPEDPPDLAPAAVRRALGMAPGCVHRDCELHTTAFGSLMLEAEQDVLPAYPSVPSNHDAAYLLWWLW